MFLATRPLAEQFQSSFVCHGQSLLTLLPNSFPKKEDQMNQPNLNTVSRDEEHMLDHGFYNKHSHEQGKANTYGLPLIVEADWTTLFQTVGSHFAWQLQLGANKIRGYEILETIDYAHAPFQTHTFWVTVDAMGGVAAAPCYVSGISIISVAVNAGTSLTRWRSLIFA
jgi:hypothetical protein